METELSVWVVSQMLIQFYPFQQKRSQSNISKRLGYKITCAQMSWFDWNVLILYKELLATVKNGPKLK